MVVSTLERGGAWSLLLAAEPAVTVPSVEQVVGTWMSKAELASAVVYGDKEWLTAA